MSTCYLATTRKTREQLAQAGWVATTANDGAPALTDGTSYAHGLDFDASDRLIGFVRYGINRLDSLVMLTDAVSEHDDEYEAIADALDQECCQ